MYQYFFLRPDKVFQKFIERKLCLSWTFRIHCSPFCAQVLYHVFFIVVSLMINFVRIYFWLRQSVWRRRYAGKVPCVAKVFVIPAFTYFFFGCRSNLPNLALCSRWACRQRKWFHTVFHETERVDSFFQMACLQIFFNFFFSANFRIETLFASTIKKIELFW